MRLILRVICCLAAGTGVGRWISSLASMVDNNLLKLTLLLAGLVLLIATTRVVMGDEGEEKAKQKEN